MPFDPNDPLGLGDSTATPTSIDVQDPLGLGSVPAVDTKDPMGLVKEQKAKTSLISELGAGIGQFVVDTAKAPVTTTKAVYGDLRTFKGAVEATGYSNAARLWMNEFRAKAGFPVTFEEEQGLAADIAAYKRARPNDPLVKQGEEYLKSVTVLSKDEKRALNRGLGNIAAIQAGGVIGKGVTAAAEVIPNEIVRKIAAIEAHSVASMVSFEIANDIAEEKPITVGSLAGSAAMGAALPVGGKVAGKVAGGILKGTGRALEPATTRVKLYVATNKLMQHLIDSSLISGEALLRKHGLSETADILTSIRSQRHSLEGKWITRVAVAGRDLSKADQDLVGTLLHEDKMTPELLARAENSAGVQRAVKEVSSILTRVGSLAQQAALVVGDSESGQLYRFVPRKDFGMPHVFVNTERFMENGKLRDEAITQIKKVLTKESWKPKVAGETLDSHAADVLERIHLRASGEYEEAAAKFGKKFSGGSQVWGRHYNLPGFHLNPFEVLPNYLSKMARNITQAAALGGDKEAAIAGRSVKDIYPQAFAQLDNIKDPDVKRRAEIVITRALGGGWGAESTMSRSAKTAVSALQKFQAVTKLGLAQIAQLSQLITPNIQVGFRDSMKDFFRAMNASPALEDQMARTGAFTNSLIREAEEKMYGASKEALQIGPWSISPKDVLRRTGFTGLDTFARKYGVLRGWSFADHQAEEFFRLTQRLPKAKGLEKAHIEKSMAKIEAKLVGLGVDTQALVKRGGTLSPEDYLKAGQSVSTDWNFWGDTLSMPVFWSSPQGRVLTQFKSFAYQQTIALNKHVVKPALDGDLGPLIRLLVAGQIGGELINDMRSLARGKPRNEQRRIYDNYAALGLLSIWGDTMQAAEKKDWISGFFAGPTGSDITEAATAAVEMSHGKPKRAVKFALQHTGPMVPFVGPLVTPAVINTVYPPKEQK